MITTELTRSAATLRPAELVTRGGRRVTFQVTRQQAEVLQSSERFRTVRATRRGGKTTLGVIDDLVKLLKLGGTRYDLLPHWWVAPTYRQAKKPYRMLISRLTDPRELGRYQLVNLRQSSRAELRIATTLGAVFEFRSAEIEDNLRGEGVYDLKIDEGPLMPDQVWYECLRPTLADTRGTVLSLFTPKPGDGWWKELDHLGISGEHPEHRSFHFSALDAAFIPTEELDLARRTMSTRAFNQEFLAEYQEGAGTVFEDPRSHRRGELLHLCLGAGIAVGIDWAKKRDWTFLVATCAACGVPIRLERARGLEYPNQVELLGRALKQLVTLAGTREALNILMDQTGVGEAVLDLCRRAWCWGDASFLNLDRVNGLILTERSKAMLIEEHVVELRSGEAAFPLDDDASGNVEALIREHEVFSLVIGPTGKITYGAREPLHDDGVIAHALASRARRAWPSGKRLEPSVEVIAL